MCDEQQAACKWTRPTYLTDPWTASAERVDLIDVPLLGWVSAGPPVDITEYRESVRVPAHMVSRATYALAVRGHSMIENGIHDGDIIVIEKSRTAENGQSIVALINGEEVTLKRFFVDREGIRLQPANPEMRPIRLRNQEMQVLGIVTGVVRSRDQRRPVPYPRRAGRRIDSGEGVPKE